MRGKGEYRMISRILFYVLTAFAVGASPALAYKEGLEQVPTHVGWDILWHHVLEDIWSIGIVFAIITAVLLAKYTRKSPDEEGNQPVLSVGASMAWAIIPVFLFLADDFWLAAQGWALWNDQRTVPEGTIEIKSTPSMWQWDFEYPDGQTTTNAIVLRQGQNYVVRGTSDDVVHSFFIPNYRIKEDVMPGRVTYVWFNTDKEGQFTFTCTEYCGAGHSNMYGKVVVMNDADYEAAKGDFGAWVDGNLQSPRDMS